MGSFFNGNLRRTAWRIAALVLCVVGWHLATRERINLGVVTFQNVPPPDEVAESAWSLLQSPLVLQHLALTNAALKFVVKNQFLSWGQPYSQLQTPATQNLFAIPDSSVPVADQRAIYLGVNRVIAHTGRTGCGARRVLISFQ
jgi:hypothetical protein